MKLENVEFGHLKKMATMLNNATFVTPNGEERLFLGGKKIKIVAITKEDLAKRFDEAIQSIPDEIVNDLPEEIIEFYNEFFADDPEDFAEEGGQEEPEEPEEPEESEEPEEPEEPEESEEPEEPEEVEAKEEVIVPEKSPTRGRPPKAPKKEEGEKPAKPKKAPAEKSVFGHKKGSQAAMLDELLNTGEPITLAELAEKSGRSPFGVKSHIKHLIADCGLTIEVKEGVYRLIKNE